MNTSSNKRIRSVWHQGHQHRCAPAHESAADGSYASADEIMETAGAGGAGATAGAVACAAACFAAFPERCGPASPHAAPHRVSNPIATEQSRDVAPTNRTKEPARPPWRERQRGRAFDERTTGAMPLGSTATPPWKGHRADPRTTARVPARWCGVGHRGGAA